MTYTIEMDAIGDVYQDLTYEIPLYSVIVGKNVNVIVDGGKVKSVVFELRYLVDGETSIAAKETKFSLEVE